MNRETFATQSRRNLQCGVLTALLLSQPTLSWAESSASPPVLEFTTGLPGKQVRLSWQATPGARYRIEKSNDLSPGSWKQIALVEASQTSAAWLDPETVATRCFYRVKQPQAEVFSIEPPVLTENGGRLVIQGQSLPPGSSLMIETEGDATQFFALVAQGDGIWHADVTGIFTPGDALTARVQAGGQFIGPAIHPVVTVSGLMADGPSSLPPAAPIPAASANNPIPGIGIVVKHGGRHKRTELNSRVASGAGLHTGGDNTPIVKGSALGNLRGTPTKLGGDCQDTGTNAQHRSGNPLYDSQGLEVVSPLYGSGMSAPLSSGLPGEAGFHACDLALNTPAGPALAWVRTYRSKGGSAPHGTSFSYDIRIEPDPASLGAAAPRVRVFDGTGRSDIFHRQPDGSYTCDGIFREGRFDGETFTLTFFDQGRWVFNPLDGSSTAGKITSIIDVHGNALTCDYDAGGLLGSVSNSLGQSLSVVHDDQGRVATVTDHTGRFVSYEYYQQGETGGPPGAVKSVSCPIIPGEPPVAEPTTYTYTTGQAHPALDGNLLTITDGEERLLEAFTYSSQTDPREVDFDCVKTHDAHRTDPASEAVSVLKLVRLADGTAPLGGYSVFHNDEAGRLTEVVCDAQHRPVSVKQFTGFTTAGQAYDATTNRPTGKLRLTDPDFFETTCQYNADGMPRRSVLPDGSELRVVFERDLNPACATRERGNARTLTLRSSSGEERTVSCDYLPGFGTPESMRPGNPIGGLTIKAGRNPNDGPMAQTRRRVEVLKSNFHDDPAARGNPIKGMIIRTGPRNGGSVYSQSDGVHGVDNDCDGLDDDCDGIGMTTMIRKILDRGEAGDNVGLLHGAKGSQTVVFSSSPPAKITRLTTAHGQSFTWSHDAQGSVLSHTTPVPGQGFSASYDNLGRCVSRTILDGDGPGFRTDVHYAASNGFLQSVVIDPDGLALTETQDCDDLGRTTRYTDPRGHQWLVEYNALDLPTRIDSPPAQGGQAVVTACRYDKSGRFICGETDHLRSDGSPVEGNESYSIFVVRDTRARISRIAVEERPVEHAPSVTDPATLGIENFAVTDISYGPDGRCVRLSTPAACRESTDDAACDFTYDERGLLHRTIYGGDGASSSVTVVRDYTPAGQLARAAVELPVLDEPVLDAPEVHYEYDGFHRLSHFTDAMGNQATFEYSSRGQVTLSVYGETADIAGSAGNVLLGKGRMRFAQCSSVPGYANGRQPTAVLAFACTARKSGPKLGGDCQDSNAFFDALTLPGIQEVCYDFEVPKPAATQSSRTSPGGGGSLPDDCDDADPVAISLPGIDDVCYELEVKKKQQAASRALFHGWVVKDDTIEMERFAPGDTAPAPVETTTITRSPAGLPLHVSRNGDSLATCGYNSAGRLTSVTNAACRVQVVRDAAGHITSSTRTDYPSAQGLAAKNFTLSRIIDAFGRVTALGDGSGNNVAFGYDSLGRVTGFTDPNGDLLRLEHEANTPDDEGNTPGGPFSVRYHKDVDRDGTPDFLGATYHRCGEPRQITCASGYTSTYTTDTLGRITRCDFPDGTYQTATFDDRGFRGETRHRDGSIISYLHDLNGRITSETITSGPAGQAPAPVRHFTYDARSLLTGIEEGSSECAWTYDSLGNVLSETQSGETITHTYNHRGRTGYATSVQWPYKLSIAETRDAFGRLTAIIARNDAGQPVSPPVATYQHLGMRVSRCDTANGVSTVHTYRGDGDPALPDTSNFGFDQCVLTESFHEGQPIFLSKKGYDYYQAQSSLRVTHATGSTRSHSHQRDPLGRIISSQIVFDAGDGILQPEHDVAYTLNARGDRLTATGGENPGQYVQSDTLPPGDAQRGRYTLWPRGPVQWDANGNLTSLPTAQGVFEYQHDTRGRLVAVTRNGDPAAEFNYDGCDRLVQRVLHNNDGLPPAITRFLYDGDVCVHEIDMSTGTPERSHVCGHTPHLRTTTGGGDTYFRHGSGSGGLAYVGPCDASLTTDATGNPVEVISFNDAGKPLFYDGDGLPSPTDQSLTGHAWLSPGALWVPSIRLHLHGGSASSPDLGMEVSKPKKTSTSSGIRNSYSLTAQIRLSF